MTEKFKDKFHKEYVGGSGLVEDRSCSSVIAEARVVAMSYEEILAEYRWYVKDPTAELPQRIMEQLVIAGKV
ncbi:hypothetical protein COT86_01080 [Candidatus Collierbacteria bacterium CG10_big_fil_rev_8_21_14_0_10_43_36]|uniref:Uncharacterized protein n=3 Tax=Candidatus Collieribacteriota TaxID=1752725 RepID=A0A2H0DVR4_9BACT|nr:hypothetical protein [bacterium]PIP86091.1 MAG: hypothetical protein COW83_00775 [Candidatus Collierbacteria bacterium CG22_combo_CG10-13_8_21_14_all_43_12]PIR99976.1 MAG: hypothetical protein COT86_01080 [Candidatus Collierbacteria bacterium CG10_big_fil_rev_8_21_14_0_10_43_36]PIZ24420.1 MAG: hypothetical protein COY48_03055 [Candidatus Collierbacteria bacterium CG_4_10_14_0_8_um_filter_43_86]PJB48400.1 MAG: hypothetical protein CO104_01355 [Candidatus Collierbacteria bacterium CG_4_9_14_3_